MGVDRPLWAFKKCWNISYFRACMLACHLHDHYSSNFELITRINHAIMETYELLLQRNILHNALYQLRRQLHR